MRTLLTLSRSERFITMEDTALQETVAPPLGREPRSAHRDSAPLAARGTPQGLRYSARGASSTPSALRISGWTAALGLALATALASSACVNSPSKLPQLDRQFYDNLSSAEQQQMLGVTKKRRASYLQTTELWAKWSTLDADAQDRVRRREVKPGDQEFAAHLAWGQPAEVHKVAEGDREVTFESFIRCTSGPKRGAFVRKNLECDGTAEKLQLALENSRVTEVKYLD